MGWVAPVRKGKNTMKNELLKGLVFRSTDEVRAAVAVAVDFYNHEQPHMSINMMTSREAGCRMLRRDKKEMDKLQAYRYKK
jgi:transposase InsO family protein